MPLIRHFDAASGFKPVSVNTVREGECLLDYMRENFDPDFGGLSADIYVNGKLLLSTDYGGSPEDLDRKIDFILDPIDRVDIITRQGYEAIVYIVIAIVAAVVAIALAPSVNPGNSENQGSSPNSKLNAATNEYRPGEAIPEVFGSPVCYPDFIQPSWYEYENNLKIQRELLCIGISEYDVPRVRSGDTLIDSIPNSSYTIYGPGSTPPPEQRLIVRETNEITNQALEAPNSESLRGTFSGQGGMVYGGSATTTIVNIGNSNIVNMALDVGDYVEIEAYEAPLQGGTNVLIFSGLFEIVNVAANTIELETGTPYAETPGYWVSGNLEVSDAGGGNAGWVGWYTVTGTKNQEVWFHMSCPRGVRTQDGGKLKIQFNMEIRQVDENGAPIPGGYTASQAGEIFESTLDAQFRTYKFTGLPAGIYQGRAIRTSDEVGGAASEVIQLEQLVGVEYQNNPSYGSVTLLWVERKASERIVGGKSSKINVDLTRKLPYYNRSTGQLETSNLVATRDFADAAAYTLIVKGKRDPSTVDLAGLYAINDRLPQDLRNFDFTFDDKDVSMAERVMTICDVARVMPFRAYQNWYFERDEAKPFPVAMFSRRNISRSSTVRQSFRQFLPSDKDGISLTYVSQPANVEKTIHRSVKNGVISSTVGSYPKEIKLPGCQTDAQAENRIEVEIRKLIYSRRAVELDVLFDGFAGKINDRVRFADINDADIFDGEVLHIIGDDYLTSERFMPEPGKTYYVQITNDDGELTNVVECQPLSYTKKGFRAVGLNGGYTADGDIIQLGSRYIIADDGENAGTDYIITDIQSSNSKSMSVSLAAYSDKIYEMD